jgi:hypothetical protein
LEQIGKAGQLTVPFTLSNQVDQPTSAAKTLGNLSRSLAQQETVGDFEHV